MSPSTCPTSPKSALLLSCVLLTLSCAVQPAAQPAPEPVPTANGQANQDPSAAPVSAPCAVPAGETGNAEAHHGLLVYAEAPRTMSVEAYEHVEFSLQTRERKLALEPSNSAPRAALMEARGREVSLCCVWKAAAEPSPMEAHPIDPDGKPLARPARCVVSSLTVGTQ